MWVLIKRQSLQEMGMYHHLHYMYIMYSQIDWHIINTGSKGLQLLPLWEQLIGLLLIQKEICIGGQVIYYF